MKNTLTLLFVILFSLSLSARSSHLPTVDFYNIPGTWIITSLKVDKSVTFAKSRNRTRGGKLTLEFNREYKVRVNETNVVFFYRVNNNNVIITDKYKNFTLNRKHRFDEIEIIGGLREGCLHVKYVKKGLGGSTNNKGYRMCKIEDFPAPTTVREPYKF